MNESNENFDELKTLLKLKRHEIPPPGYFNHFSGDVVSRIRAGEAGGAQSFFERLNEQVPWLVDLLRIFETKPGAIGGFAVSLCLLLLVGVVLADRPDATPAEASALASAQPAQAATPAMPELTTLAPADDNSGIAISGKPVNSLQPSLQPVATLFGQSQNPLFQVQNASLLVGGQ